GERRSPLSPEPAGNGLKMGLRDCEYMPGFEKPDTSKLVAAVRSCSKVRLGFEINSSAQLKDRNWGSTKTNIRTTGMVAVSSPAFSLSHNRAPFPSAAQYLVKRSGNGIRLFVI